MNVSVPDARLFPVLIISSFPLCRDQTNISSSVERLMEKKEENIIIPYLISRSSRSKSEVMREIVPGVISNAAASNRESHENGKHIQFPPIHFSLSLGFFGSPP